MSEITVNSTQRQAPAADTATNARRAAKSSVPAEVQISASVPHQGDTVTLTSSAQTAQVSPLAAGLTEEAANETSVNLRQQLGVNSLSVSAKQNQSILSLLRG